MERFRSIGFRSAGAGDLDFLRRLRTATMRDVVLRHQPWIEDEQESRVRAGFEAARIIRSGDIDIGVLKVIRAADHVRLLQLQLLPDYQGRGIGTELIRSLQAECVATEQPLVLHVYRSNRAMRLYTRLGFEVVEQSEHSVVMRWNPKRPNQSPEPTSLSVTICACAQLAPASAVAHL